MALNSHSVSGHTGATCLATEHGPELAAFRRHGASSASTPAKRGAVKVSLEDSKSSPTTSGAAASSSATGVRPYGSGCTHEHACIRCQFLTVHPDARPRLDTIDADLNDRISTAVQQSWLGDVEQLRVTLTRLRDKRHQLGDTDMDTTDSITALLQAPHPALEIPTDMPS